MTPSCSNRVKQNSISFHRLSIKDSTATETVEQYEVKKPPNLKYCKLCSRRFTEDCYEQDLKLELLEIKKQVKVKNDAVPTLFDFSFYGMLTGKN